MMTIEAVPQSITREQYLSLMAAVGFDPNELRLLEFRTDGIYAEAYALNEAGNRYGDPMTNETVVNRVFIPVKD